MPLSPSRSTHSHRIAERVRPPAALGRRTEVVRADPDRCRARAGGITVLQASAHLAVALDRAQLVEVVAGTFDGSDVLVDIPALTMLGYDVDPVLIAAARDVFLLDLEGSMIELSFYDGELPLQYGVSRNFVLQRDGMAMPRPLPDPALVHAWVARATATRPLEMPRLLR
jgi:hypothetical protein